MSNPQDIFGAHTPDPVIVAQPAPAVGQVIPDAVETPAGAPPFIYPYGWKAGDSLLPGQGTIQSVLDQEVRAGAITPDEAEQSARNSGVTGYLAPRP